MWFFANHYNLASVIKSCASKWSWWLWLWFLIYEAPHPFLMLALSKENAPSAESSFYLWTFVKWMQVVGALTLSPAAASVQSTCSSLCLWTGLQFSAFKSTAYSFGTVLHLTCRVKLDDDSGAFSSLHNSLGFKVPVSCFRAKSYLHELYRYSHFRESMEFILLLQTNLWYKNP